jgi:hypothetical protein
VFVPNRITVTITGPGESDIVITGPEGTLDGKITLSRGGLNSVPQDMRIRITDASFTGIEWYIDGRLAGVGAEMTLKAVDYLIQEEAHELSVMAFAGNRPYAKTILVEVVK